MLERIVDSFQEYPIQSLLFIALFTLMAILIFEMFNMKHNRVRSQVSFRLGKELEKKFDIGQAIMEKFENYSEKVDLLLKKANVLFTVREYFTFMAFGMAGGAFVGVIVFPAGAMWELFFGWVGNAFMQNIFARLFAGVILAAVGSLAPKIWLQVLISKRKKLIENQLQDVLLNIADALKSGHVIQEAIRIVGKEMSYPLGPEFLKAYREMETGKTLFAALGDLKKRVDMPNFTMAINAIEIQFEVGGKLEPLLRKMVKVIQDRVELKQEMDKSIASSKTVGYFLLAAPLFFVIMFSMMNSETYIDMLKNPIGIAMVVAAGACYAVAAFIIFYILRDLSKEV